MTPEEFFSSLWTDYVAMAPQAQQIRQAFESQGETVSNDHVAFRTLGLEPIGIERLEPHVLALGYRQLEPYEFPSKKLRAYGYVSDAPDAPRIFLSELKVEELSAEAGEILRRCASQVDATKVESPEVLWSGRLWDPVTWDEYQLLASESEYAAWVATLGLRPNHFTINVNQLTQTTEIEEVLQVVEGLGYAVNDSGGRVKGSPAQLLEQGSTMADRMQVDFAGGEQHEVPTCYYEFAKRYPDSTGKLFPGFVATSADKIFESTDNK
ncbi:DUF1338 domain-containing protein [Aeoliella mucimassa]|uniref:2-oxoadipate dioxygenase/decarboxylase n=1 Tax=Aeoliella mucimassa TaxID=2527972 RepID=A0A518AT03_9BACT|nr:DUF1338 domain-containing protein [Aeoliella mucimassa]QDU57873.1 hypothetical protein Pan181_40960 [Aeoliella mucimassa]